MAEFGADSPLPAVDLSVYHNSHADTMLNRYNQKIVDAHSFAEPLLGERDGVGIVFNVCRNLKAVLNHVLQVGIALPVER